MNILAFVVVILIYIYICYLGVRFYFFTIFSVNQFFQNVVARNLVAYVLFVIFISIEIPLAVFFPLWSGEKIVAINHNSTAAGILVVFGCCVLVFSCWLGWRKSKKEISS